MKKTLVVIALVVLMVMALAAPASARISHSINAEVVDGTIDWITQAGHLCNTGAQIRQQIVGDVETFVKMNDVVMVTGKIDWLDDIDFVAGATGLTVTTVWELCAPPKYTYESGVYDGVVHPYAMFRGENQPQGFVGLGIAPGSQGFSGENYNNGTVNSYNRWEAVSDQIWAVQVAADPGFSGALYQDGTAAHGPFWGTGAANRVFNNDAGWTQGTEDRRDHWRWRLDAEGRVKPNVGAHYVGSYFNMNEQHVRTSQGTVRRFIDISSPFSHGYKFENMTATGTVDIHEGFSMTNLPAGADVPGKWWDLGGLF